MYSSGSESGTGNRGDESLSRDNGLLHALVAAHDDEIGEQALANRPAPVTDAQEFGLIDTVLDSRNVDQDN